jgi:NADH:ubiquinone oxidoreductase subunit E
MFAGASHNSKLSAVSPLPGSVDVLARAAELIADCKPDDVDLLKALHRIQHEWDFIPRETITLLAAKFDTTPAIIYGTIDFYSELRQKQPAEHVVEWCSGPACLLKNSAGIRRALEATLGCYMGAQSADGKHELRLVQCDGTCHLAPLIRYRGKYIGPLSTTQAIEFARSLGPTAGGEPLEGGLPPAAHPPRYEEAAGGPGRDPVAGPRPMAEPGNDPTREPGE